MIVVDTGPLVAAADADDDHHETCRPFLERHAHELVVPSSVVVEACWLISSTLGPRAEAELLLSVADGELRVEDLNLDDYRRAAELVVRYDDLKLGMVDATVVAVAERLGASRVATLDRRDFSVVRPSHVDAFQLLP